MTQVKKVSQIRISYPKKDIEYNKKKTKLESYVLLILFVILQQFKNEALALFSDSTIFTFFYESMMYICLGIGFIGVMAGVRTNGHTQNSNKKMKDFLESNGFSFIDIDLEKSLIKTKLLKETNSYVFRDIIPSKSEKSVVLVLEKE